MKVIILGLSIIILMAASYNDKRVQKIYKNVKCVVCDGQSIADSNSQLAKDMQKIILDKVNNNYSDEQIYAFLVDRYGYSIIFEPPINQYTILLWWTPFLIIILGMLVIRIRFFS
jgi:cytochrome c-type biogenesis protein CcmH